MIASATEIEVELNVPEEVSTFFGVTWAQDPLKDKVFIKAFPRGANGRMGLLESTGLVEIGDCLTSINGVPLGKATLQEVMASIRSAKSPLSLRFARYPAPPPPQLSMPTSPASTIGSSSKSRGESGFDSSSPNDARHVEATAAGAMGTGEHERREDAELDDVLNSALLVGLGERVADIQKRNAKLLQAVGRVGHAASVKRDGVERVASAASALTAEAATLPRTLETLTAARQNASAVCEAMARLDELLAARERAQEARRRTNEEGALPVVVSGGNSASEARAQAPTKSR